MSDGTKIVKAESVEGHTAEALAEGVTELLESEQGVNEVHLVATNAQQMASSQARLALWLKAKLVESESEILELSDAREQAKRHKWRTSTFASQLAKAEKRKVFYEKLLIASEAGYTIVPSFPIDIIAIRTDREWPSDTNTHTWNNQPMATASLAERADTLPVGEGRYVSPLPSVRRSSHSATETGRQVMQHSVRAISLKDVEFPVQIAIPEVMDATARAMALKVFDQIGVCPAKNIRVDNHRLAQVPPVKDPDPLIIGQVAMKGPYGLVRPVSFLIAWHLDLRTL